jgi:ubiquinone/menaquinone biosynthesis C-methylase UbiE
MTDQRQQSVDFYETEAAEYDSRRWSSPVGRYLDETQKSIVVDLIGDIDGKTVLDVATGTGRFALEMARLGATVHAVDTSPAMLSALMDKASKEGLEGRIIPCESDGAKLPFESEMFDLATCINALNHIPDAPDVVHDISRVLKPGGTCVANFTVWSSVYLPFGLVINLRDKSLTRDVFTHWFGKREIYSIFGAADMIVQRKVGAIQFPSSLRNSLLIKMCIRFDRLLRRVWGVAPMLFVVGSKQA